MNRRTACCGLVTGALGAMLYVPRSQLRNQRVGLQLYTVRDRMQRDLAGTLAVVGAIGYREVEFAGYFGKSPRQVREAARRARLDPVSTHIPIEMLREDLHGAVEMAAEIGHRYVVLPWLNDKERRSLDGYRALADEMNGFGEAVTSAGLRFAYHNHSFEFEPIDGVVPYDLLLERTDPRWVAMELDLYWVTVGGRQPLEYFEAWPGRFPLWHVKDMGPDGGMVDVGAGHIDFGAIFEHAEQAGMRHYFVEHDQPKDSLATARASYEYLSHLQGGSR